MSLAMDSKLQKRKLDALRRGIHRIGTDEILPFSVNIVGIGKAGADVAAEFLKELPETGPKIAVLVIDIGDEDLSPVRTAAAALPPDRADVQIISLQVPTATDLQATFRRYPEFLKLEFPMFHWTSTGNAWLPPSAQNASPRDGVSRAFAKAVYGRGYYDGDRTLRTAMRRFGASVMADPAQAVVCTVFGMGGGTGSAIVVDLARHLANVVFGRQALMLGLAILPCAGDRPSHRGSALFAALNELDCLGDETKNQGVIAACGDLFRNPFTAGFLVVPQEPVWDSTHDLAITHQRVTEEIGGFLTARGGMDVWETLRMLNWVAAPSTQHSAARTPWGPKWIHMLGFADATGSEIPLRPDLPARIGLRDSYRPEFIELRVPDPQSPTVAEAAAQLDDAFHPHLTPQVAVGGRPGSIQFVLPSISKTDLALFSPVRAAYDGEDTDQRLLDHAMLLEQGVVLSEPSTRLEGMAGASLQGSDGWVAVPFQALRGEENVAPQRVPVLVSA